MEREKEQKKEVDMLDKIYGMRQEEMELESKQDRKELKSKLNGVKFEEIEKEIENKLMEKEKNGKKKIIEQIGLLIENYEIQISYYSEKNYKQGFKDGLGLYNQCLNEE